MIRSFRCHDTEALAGGNRVKRFVNIEVVARRKLRRLEIASRAGRLADSSRQTARSAERQEIWPVQHRINDQWRVCFPWADSGVEDVEIVDCHRGDVFMSRLDPITPGELLLRVQAPSLPSWQQRSHSASISMNELP